MITIKGNPISVNSLYRGRRFLTKEGKVLKESYMWQVKSQYKSRPSEGRLEVTIYAYFGSNRSRDLDNIGKVVLDSMTGIVYKDDSQIDALHIYRKYDKENPRVEILIK